MAASNVPFTATDNESHQVVRSLRHFLVHCLSNDYSYTDVYFHAIGFGQPGKRELDDWKHIAQVQTRVIEKTKEYRANDDEEFIRRHVTMPGDALGLPEDTVRNMLLSYDKRDVRFEGHPYAINGFNMLNFAALAKKLYIDREILFRRLFPNFAPLQMQYRNEHLQRHWFKVNYPFYLRGPARYKLSDAALRFRKAHQPEKARKEEVRPIRPKRPTREEPKRKEAAESEERGSERAKREKSRHEGKEREKKEPIPHKGSSFRVSILRSLENLSNNRSKMLSFATIPWAEVAKQRIF